MGKYWIPALLYCVSVPCAVFGIDFRFLLPIFDSLEMTSYYYNEPSGDNPLLRQTM